MLARALAIQTPTRSIASIRPVNSLPAISVSARTQESRSSATRLLFSSTSAITTMFAVMNTARNSIR